MKKCPYCAEEIKEDATFCRYCQKRVKGVPLKFIIAWAIILAIAFSAITHKNDIKRFTFDAKNFFKDLGQAWETFKDILEDMKDGLVSMAEHKRRTNTLTGDIMTDMNERGGK